MAAAGGGSLAGHPLRLRAAAGRLADTVDPDDASGFVGHDHDPGALGRLYETLLERRGRRDRGVFFTPAPIADALVIDALAGLDVPAAAMHVCDPSAGGGAFLLAAARALADRGVPHRHIVEHLLFGADTDAVALAVAEIALALWAWDGTEPPALVAAHLAVADGLRVRPATWPDAPAGGFELVAGNPPFLGQLTTRTARSRAETEALRARFGDAGAAYTDTAALFLLAACELTRTGGRVALVQPESVLAARDARRVRERMAATAGLRAVWIARQPVFDAGARVWAPVFEVGGTTGPTVRRREGTTARPTQSLRISDRSFRNLPTWAPLASGLDGSPVPVLPATSGRLGDLCHATADFRDQYYGLVPHVVEGMPDDDDRDSPPLVTSGLIDPAWCRWGSTPARFARRRWHAPRVRLPALRRDGLLASWADERLVPKLLMATQTRVVEAIVDRGGRYLPCTPVVTVTADGDALWDVAAVVLAPPVTAWARWAYAGAALSSDAIKLSARQLLEAPLPESSRSWATGARWLRELAAARRRPSADDLRAFGAAMCDAYAIDDGGRLLEWWCARLPARG